MSNGTHLFGTVFALGIIQTFTGLFFEIAVERVVLDVEPLESLELAEADRKRCEPVLVEVEVLQLLEVAEAERQLGQLVLAEIELDDVRQLAELRL